METAESRDVPAGSRDGGASRDGSGRDGGLVAAAVCPGTPLLLPGLAGQASDDLDGLRAACAAAVHALVDAAPAVVVLVGAGDATRTFPADAAGSSAPYGGDLAVRLTGQAADGERPLLPLTLTVGAWLLGASGWHGEVLGLSVAPSLPPAECADAGRRLAADHPRAGLLVVADGSARRAVRAPEDPDADAVAFDDRVAAALGAADPAALLALDPAASADVLAVGRAPLQVLAGAAGDRAWAGDLLLYDAPFGVGYLVASWRPAVGHPRTFVTPLGSGGAIG